jgi:hypothetical protein
MSDERRTYSVQTAKLAIVLDQKLSGEDLMNLYDTLRQSVYGIPGGAVSAVKLVYFLAELNGWSDPAGSEER